ncbi:MAG: flagellar hook-associated protein FlgK [Alphaproteobacteria bacterium]|nr:MAG: flagellar hook-associated protein FlgK [Alphaproteobacteria bacterium]
MSISTALSNAVSGLAAMSRAAELSSNNVANALTEGYSRRIGPLSAHVLDGHGHGVQMDLPLRVTDPRAVADRRRADAAEGEAAALDEGLARLARAYGDPGEAGSLADRALAFEAALGLARDTPESTNARAGLLDAAKSLAERLNRISTENQRLRMAADAAIARQVETVNTALQSIESINQEIRVRNATGREVAALEDERQKLVDQVNRIIPIRTASRQDGAIALYTGGGAVLVDGPAATLGFTATGVITADMTVGSGALSQLTIDGNPVTVGQGGGPVDGGTLGAAFALRDVTGPASNARIDALAADLMQRFEAVDTDGTGAGLFTDAGSPYNAATQDGLAGRIAINAAADPDQGGALYRLRDGLSATAPGIAGDDTLLTAMTDAFTAQNPAPAGTGVSGALSGADLAGAVAAIAGHEAGTGADRAAYWSGRLFAMREAELAVSGVDTDQEMQRLLQIETSYAANAKVIETVDFLLKRLMEI